MVKKVASVISGFNKERWWQDPMHRADSLHYFRLSTTRELSTRLEARFEQPTLDLCIHLGREISGL